jgi:hypothetical protein
LTQSEHLFSDISWWEQATFWWDDDVISFVLSQHTELYFYRANPLRLSESRYAIPLEHVILNPRVSDFASYIIMLRGNVANSCFIVFGSIWTGDLNQESELQNSSDKITIVPLLFELCCFQGSEITIVSFICLNLLWIY